MSYSGIEQKYSGTWRVLVYYVKQNKLVARVHCLLTDAYIFPSLVSKYVDASVNRA